MCICVYACVYVCVVRVRVRVRVRECKGENEGVGLPLKTVFTVAKYEPMGMTIMAKVKARSLTMTSMGTAGAMLDCWSAAGLEPTVSSFSRMVFSSEMILRVAILDGVEEVR